MSGLRETNEQTMIAAHKAGVAYWQRNKPVHATREDLESLARSCGWRGEDNAAWIAGYYGAQRRDDNMNPEDKGPWIARD